MAHFYFHCSSAEEIRIDRCGSDVEDLVEAHARAIQLIQAAITATGPEDWRDWAIDVRDDEGEEVFLVPFSSTLGRPH
jgi:uncharacterized protein DUF6894